MEGLVVFVFLLPLTAAVITCLAAPRLQRDSVRVSIAGMVATFALTAFLLGLALSRATPPVRFARGVPGVCFSSIP